MSDVIEILLVEDNPDDLELTQRVFKKYNITNRVQIAQDGAEALEYLFGTNGHATRSRADQPKIILLDLKLPKINGLEVLERVKSDPRTKSIPVIALTSSRESTDLSRCYELGVNSYIVKPVDFEQFVEVVRQLGLYWLMINQPNE